ncbi:MAG TPA: DegV family protein [Dehalococcoidia bacterium]|nr:DegV family protein [Dehalococcoidia bacterium]
MAGSNKVGVITDSIACLTRELVAEYGIRIIPLNFHFGDRNYRDWVDITPTEAYELFLKDPESFYTSPPSATEYLKAYREVGARTRNVLCITLSSKLSTTYNVACIAREQVGDELPEVSIEVVDSRAAAAAQGFIVLAAAREAMAGKSLAEVVKTAEEMKGKVNFLVLLDTVRYVYRSGRIPKIASQAGSMLNIRPLLSMSAGALCFKGAVRSREHGIERVFRILREKAGRHPIHVAVMHAYALDEAEQLMAKVAAEFDCVELWLTEFSPLMGYACGTGTLGLAFYTEE